jgi:APA family basic amino acid/polyamine antiporter
MYGVGLILGAGIYVLIGDVAAIAGNAMWISFLIASVVAAFTGLSYAELSSMFPKSAAEYMFVKNAFNNDLAAFVAGWLIIVVAFVSAAAVAIGFSAYLNVFLPQVPPLLSAVVLIGVLSAVNFIGIRESAWMNTAFTIIEMLGLVVIIVAAVLSGSSQTKFFEMPPPASESLSLSVGAIMSATGLVFFAYFGFENLANISEETKNASRTIPRALLISVLITTILYVGIAVSAISLVGWEKLSSSKAPLALAAEKAFGSVGVVTLSIIALFATTNTVLMMLVAVSRIMFGMAQEGALHLALGKVHATRKTPWISIVATMIITIAIIALSGGSISTVANISVFIMFIVYALVNSALIWLRYSCPNHERPFKSPVTLGHRFPLLAGLGLVSSLAMLSKFEPITICAGIATIAIGVAAYKITSRHDKLNGHSKNRNK